MLTIIWAFSETWFFFYKISFLFFKFLFIYLWLCWVFVSVRGPSPAVASGGHSSSRCAGLSLSRPLLLRSTGSRRAGSAINGSRAQPLRSPWDPPRPGFEPVSPALAGGPPTTAPPGKPETWSFCWWRVLPWCWWLVWSRWWLMKVGVAVTVS